MERLKKKIYMCMLLLVGVTSYEVFFLNSFMQYIDEILIISLFCLTLFFFNKYHYRYSQAKKNELLMVTFCNYSWIIYGLFVSILSQMFSMGEFVTSFTKFLKMILLFYSFAFLDMDTEEWEKYLFSFILISIPSLLYGYFQYYQFHVLDIHIVGKYELVDNEWILRLQAFANHPIDFGYQLVYLSFGLLYFIRKSEQYQKLKVFLFVASVVLCYLTGSLLPFVSLGVALCFDLFFYHKYYNKYLLIFISLYIAFVVFVLYKFGLFQIYGDSEKNTIRYLSTMKTLHFIAKNPFGYGFGAYAHASLGEAEIFEILFNFGLIGFVLYLVPYFFQVNKFLNNYNYSSLILFFCVFMICLIFNKIYNIPSIFWMFLFFRMPMVEQKEISLFSKPSMRSYF